MTAFTTLQDRLKLSQRLYDDLVNFFPEAKLACKLPNLPSNTVGQQLWCVVGGRESYAKAIAAGNWQGFSCSLASTSVNVGDEVKSALLRSANELDTALTASASPTDAQWSLALQLLEHEAQHHGQLVRYLYGLKLGVPASWKSRYHLD